MKLLIVFLAMMSFAYAGESFKVTNLECGDFDQYYVGEVCVLYLKSNTAEQILVVDLFEYLDLRLDLYGKEVEINSEGLKSCAPEAYEEIRVAKTKSCLWVRYGDILKVISEK